LQRLNEIIEKSRWKEITLYVHGANNNFYRTASQAAQYAHFTGRQALVILYSWPSAESIIRYGKDIANIRETVPVLARFIRLLAKHSTVRRINLLAYSAGATLATETLALLGEDTSIPDRKAYKDSLRLGSVYFAAPDTDLDEFVQQYRNYHDIIDHVTITVNPDDTVLAIAQAYRFGKAEQDRDELDTEEVTTKSRLGAPNVDDISEEDAQWLIELSHTPKLSLIVIDAKAIPVVSKGAHDYWYSSPWISTDTLLELNIHATPAQRGLSQYKGKHGARVWYFPPDYDQRVAVIIKQWVEELERRESQLK
jgi:esterase/lipase superfamily enzyme